MHGTVHSERAMPQSSNTMPCRESDRQNWRVRSYSAAETHRLTTVSYTHLTLPTILRV